MRKLKILLFVLSVFLAIAPATFGAQIRLSKSNISRLVDQPIITAIYRDRLGFLWIGTQEGLYKFDGANLTVFNSDGGNENWIPSSDIRDISTDPNGALLIATYGGGLLQWDSTSNSFVSKRSLNSVADLQITSLYSTSNGDIWVGTEERLFLYSENIEAQQWITQTSIMSNLGRPLALAEDTSGKLFMGSSLGLFEISVEKKTIEKYDLTPLGNQGNLGVTTLLFDHSGNLIIGTDTGQLALVDVEARRVLNQATIAADTQRLITCFTFYERKLLIATDKGLYLSEPDLTYLEDISREGAGLSSSDVITLYSDQDSVWIGTYNGLDRLSLTPFDLFSNSNSAINNDILRFEQDSKGRIWVGTYDGLFRFDDASKSHIRFESQFPSTKLIDHRVTALFSSGTKLWVGYYAGGLEAIDIDTGAIVTPPIKHASKMSVMDLYESLDDGSLWIATLAHGLIRVTSNETYYYYESGSLPEKGISLIFDNIDSLIFVSTANTVYKYDFETEKISILNFEFDLGPNKAVIFSIAKDRDGDVWFGTKDHGIYRWESSSQKSGTFEITHIGERTILEYSTIYGIFFDISGNLWSATQNGVVKANSNGMPIKRFTRADGLQGDDFSFGASFTSKEGLIYFGGINGYNRFDPTAIDIDDTPSPMRLTGVKLPGSDNQFVGELTELKTLQLSHIDRFVTFQFSVLDFIDAERNEFRYMLENFDADWVENGNKNTATYTNLPPGDYVFRVQGANSAGIWNRDGITLEVEVLPPPWRSWWAYLIYATTLMLLIWGLHRIYRSYAIDRKSAELALEMFEAENRADDDMQEQLEITDEIVQAAYDHTLTTLSLVRDCIHYRLERHSDHVKQDLTESGIRRISALSSLEDYISFHAGGAFANLQKYTDGIFPALFDCTSLRPETIVTINDVTSMPIPARLASPISIVLYELLENCFQHAFPDSSPANYIHVKLLPQTSHAPVAHFLELIVQDSGIGLPDYVEGLVRAGSGLAIVTHIVSSLDGTIDFSVNNGTIVSISIPNRT